jgi:hypothetical protein
VKSACLRRGSAATRLLKLRVRILPGAWMFVCCDCSVSSGRGFCVGLITHPEESYRVLCMSQGDRESSMMRRPWLTRGCCATEKISLCEFHFVQYRSGLLHLTIEYVFLRTAAFKAYCAI